MNINRQPPQVPERDWIAQERALSPDARDRRDALLAHALRTMPASAPPPGFAAEVARLAAAGAMPARADEGRLERGLVNGLLLLMAVCSLGALAWYGQGWWTTASTALGGSAAQWALVGAACLALSWLPGGARRLYEAMRAVPAPA